MAQRSRALVALAVGLSSVPSTHITTDNHLQLEFQRILYPLLASGALDMHAVHIHTCRENMHLIKMNKSFPSVASLDMHLSGRTSSGACDQLFSIPSSQSMKVNSQPGRKAEISKGFWEHRGGGWRWKRLL